MDSAPRPALFISVDTEQDWLVACPYGGNGNGRPDEDRGADQLTDAEDLLATLDAQLAPRRRRPRGDRIELWGDELPQPGRQRIEISGEDLAVVLSSSPDRAQETGDAVIAVRLPHCVVLACATGHGGGAAAHLALRVLAGELTDGGDPSALAPEQHSDL